MIPRDRMPTRDLGGRRRSAVLPRLTPRERRASLTQHPLSVAELDAVPPRIERGGQSGGIEDVHAGTAPTAAVPVVCPLCPGRGGDLHVGPAELPLPGDGLVEGGETVQETAQPVHLPAVRVLRGGWKGRRDVGARHRCGRTSAQPGDEGDAGTAPSACMCGQGFLQPSEGLYCAGLGRRIGPSPHPGP